MTVTCLVAVSEMYPFHSYVYLLASAVMITRCGEEMVWFSKV